MVHFKQHSQEIIWARATICQANKMTHSKHDNKAAILLNEKCRTAALVLLIP